MTPDDAICLASRLRSETTAPDSEPFDTERILPRHYPVACVTLPGLTVRELSRWLERHQTELPEGLNGCSDRRLRGAVIALKGFGLLFADRNDPEHDRAFTYAHEGAHYLGEHRFPRDDLRAEFGDAIIEAVDGLRPATREEAIALALARQTLGCRVHLLDRESRPSANLNLSEERADRFACELRAPFAALEAAFGTATDDAHGLAARVEALLRFEFRLPERYVSAHAAAFVVCRVRVNESFDRFGLRRQLAGRSHPRHHVELPLRATKEDNENRDGGDDVRVRNRSRKTGA